jgi:hypoxanthine phosphoribosyltransferase
MAITKKEYLEWSDIDELVLNIADDICKSSLPKFKTILAIARGGLIPAQMLAYKLGIKEVQLLGIRSREENGDIKHPSTIEYYGGPKLGGNVLVVDDINDSGLSFSAVENYIQLGVWYENIDVLTYAALIKRHNTNFESGHYGKLAKNDHWYVFPWD